MLCYVFTDAVVDSSALQNALGRAVNQSFNRISIDGDQSTNDTVLLLANGLAGNEPLRPAHAAWPAFQQGLDEITLALAQQIVRDGEGASRLVTVRVEGAASDGDANRVARAICNSLLIKTSWAGGDPNWGRVLCAIGYSGALVDPENVDVFYDDVTAVRSGVWAQMPLDRLRAVAARDAFTLLVSLHQGGASAVVYACDTTEAYVRMNVEE
jgi:glutamate N-acetyltransferase/amino-acid N-acetyltransferase